MLDTPYSSGLAGQTMSGIGRTLMFGYILGSQLHLMETTPKNEDFSLGNFVCSLLVLFFFQIIQTWPKVEPTLCRVDQEELAVLTEKYMPDPKSSFLSASTLRKMWGVAQLIWQ